MADIANDEDFKANTLNGIQSGRSIDINAVNPYKFVEEAYHGTGGFLDGSYLINHEREASFVQRQGYSFYPNHFRPIIDALVNPVFKTPPERVNNSESEAWNIFEENCNLKGDSLTKFMRRAATRAKRDGVLFIIMDNFSNQPENRADAINNRILPYIYWRKAIDCVYYKIDKFGRLIEIAFKESYGETTSGDGSDHVYRLWTQTEWYVFKKFDADKQEFKEKIESGIIAIGKLPIITLMTGDPESDPILPVPPLYNVAKLGAAVFNLVSEYREIQRRIGFPILAVPFSGSSPKNLELGAGTILFYPGEQQTNEPKFIQPSEKILDVYLQGAKDYVQEMYRQAKLDSITGVKSASSGISKEWDNKSLESELADLSRVLEFTEESIVEMFKLWANEPGLDVTISYPEDFGISDFENMLKNDKLFIDLGMPEEVVKEVKKDLVSAMFSDRDPKTREELMAFVDNYNQQPEQIEIVDNIE